MKKLFKRNYRATVKRGLITPKTKAIDYIDKIEEETREAKFWIKEHGIINLNEYAMEITDIMCVCASQLIDLGINPKKYLEKVTEKNENRND